MTEHQEKILDIPFTTLYQSEVLEKIRQALAQNKKLFLATPNPEMLLSGLEDPTFQKILQSTDLNLPDGNGLIWANKFIYQTQKKSNPILISLLGIGSLIAFIWHSKNEKIRFNKALHGSDLTFAMLNDPDISKHSFFFLGNKHGLNPDTAKISAKTLLLRQPHLKIAGQADSDPQDQSLIDKINNSKAEILLVGFGSPAQETWIHNNFKKLEHIKVAIGIGGTFDFIAGVIPRAPKLMQRIGLEWLFRLYKQPKRIKRIFNATVVFPYEIIVDQINSHHRANPDKNNT